MAREPCPSRGTLAFCGRRRASASLRTRAYPLGDGLSGGGETDRLSAGIKALSVSTNVRQQKTPESSSLSNAAPETPLGACARVAKAENRMAECLQRSKSETGLADYE